EFSYRIVNFTAADVIITYRAVHFMVLQNRIEPFFLCLFCQLSLCPNVHSSCNGCGTRTGQLPIDFNKTRITLLEWPERFHVAHSWAGTPNTSTRHVSHVWSGPSDDMEQLCGTNAAVE